MCEEKQIITKVCKSCKRELPLEAFAPFGRAKDKHTAVCKACKAKVNDNEGNPELFKFTPRQLLDELKHRGYHGSLTFIQKYTIIV